MTIWRHTCMSKWKQSVVVIVYQALKCIYIQRLHVVLNQQSYKINKIHRIVQRTPLKKVIKRLVQ